jgi:hypothetical protein
MGEILWHAVFTYLKMGSMSIVGVGFLRIPLHS